MKNRACRSPRSIGCRLPLVVALTITAATTGCGGGDTYLPPVAQPLPTLTNLPTGCPTSEDAADLYATVASGSCALDGCHGTNPNTFQLASAADLRAQLVGKPSKLYAGVTIPLVTAGDLNKSWIMYKLTGNQGQYGSKMPLGSPLTSAQLCKFVAWINSGAP